MKKLIIYDFDGVLVDSVNAITLYYDKFFEHLGLNSPNWGNPNLLSDVRGMSFEQFISSFIPQELQKKFRAYSPEFTLEEMAKATPLQPEADSVIPELSGRYNLAICTNRDGRGSVEDILEYYGVRQYFSFIITAAEAEPKPSGDGLKKILARFGEKTALYIGDSEVDHLAAQSASVPFLGYNTSIEGIDFITRHSEVYKYL
jgi:phosphoglycolate phosphatase-like HAD superfamily hydrolase